MKAKWVNRHRITLVEKKQMVPSRGERFFWPMRRWMMGKEESDTGEWGEKMSGRRAVRTVTFRLNC